MACALPFGWLYTTPYSGALPASWRNSRDRIVVSTSRCGRDNPGSNPGHGRGCAVSIMATPAAFYFLLFLNSIQTLILFIFNCEAISVHAMTQLSSTLLGWALTFFFHSLILLFHIFNFMLNSFIQDSKFQDSRGLLYRNTSMSPNCLLL